MSMSFMCLFDSSRSVGLYLNKTRLGSMHHEIFKDNFGIFVLSTTHANFKQWHTPWKRGPSTARQRASSQPHKHWKKYVKHHIDWWKNKHTGERKGKDVIVQIRRRKWHLECDVVQGVPWCGYEVCAQQQKPQEVWKCAFNNWLFFTEITIFWLQKHNRST